MSQIKLITKTVCGNVVPVEHLDRFLRPTLGLSNSALDGSVVPCSCFARTKALVLIDVCVAARAHGTAALARGWPATTQ